MTMSAPTETKLEIPPPGFPMITRVISERLFPAESEASQKTVAVGCPHCQKPISVPAPADEKEKKDEQPIVWIVNSPHPLLPDMKIIRMFAGEEDSIDVYSLAKDGTSGIINTIPARMLRLTESAMPLNVFVEQIQLAESDEDYDPEEEEEEEPEQEAPPAAAATSVS